MARHSKENGQKTESKVDKLRNQTIEKFFGLTDRVMQHIEWSILATKPCMSCDSEGKAKAQDAQGQCAMCRGTKLIPDVQQRNWATEEIVVRIAPAPKSVEMTVDQTSHVEELEKELEKLPEDELQKQLAALRIVN